MLQNSSFSRLFLFHFFFHIRFAFEVRRERNIKNNKLLFLNGSVHLDICGPLFSQYSQYLRLCTENTGPNAFIVIVFRWKLKCTKRGMSENSNDWKRKYYQQATAEFPYIDDDTDDRLRWFVANENERRKRRNSDYIVTDAWCGENGYRLRSINELRAGDDVNWVHCKCDFFPYSSSSSFFLAVMECSFSIAFFPSSCFHYIPFHFVSIRSFCILLWYSFMVGFLLLLLSVLKARPRFGPHLSPRNVYSI